MKLLQTTYQRLSESTQSRTILVIFIIAFSVRLSFLLSPIVIPLMPSFNFPENLDFVHPSYDKIAKNILDGHGFALTPGKPFFGRGPIYPLLMAAVYAISGRSVILLRVVMYLISSLNAVIVYLLGKKLISVRIGRWSGIMYALYIPEAYVAHKLFPEPLITLFILLSVYFTFKYASSLSVKSGFQAGLVYGLGILTKQTLLFFPPILLTIALVFNRGNLKRKLLISCITLGTTLLVVAPWTMRNYIASEGYFVPVHTYGGSIAMVSDAIYENFPIFVSGGKLVEDFIDIARKREMKIINEAGFNIIDSQNPAQDKILRRAAFQRYREQPEFFLRKILFFLPKFWYMGENVKISHYALILHLPIYILFFIGLVRIRFIHNAGMVMTIIISLILYFNLAHSIFFTTFRYAIPLMPMILMIVAEPVIAIFDYSKRRLSSNKE